MRNHTIKFAAISLLALSAACTKPFNGQEHALTVAEQHPIAVSSQVVTLTIDANSASDTLSNIDKARLRSFADAYLTNGHGPLTITAPSGSGANNVATEAAADIRGALHEAGVSWNALNGATYRTGGASGDQLIVSYTRYVATPSACGDWSDTKFRDYRNLTSPNFGCATQNNFAALVADPRDLIEPSASSPRDAIASERALTAYRTGESTASEIEDIETGLSEQ